MKYIVFALAVSGLATTAIAHEVVHASHDHRHGADCGHTLIEHEDHEDALHDGHMHGLHDGHVDEHTIAVSDANPDGEVSGTHSSDHGHVHGSKDCAHEMVPHGNHQDALHDGHLHHPHGDHVDEHGAA